MKFRLPIFMLLVLPAALSAAGPDRDPRFRTAGERTYRQSLDDVVSGVRQRHPGKVLSADTLQENGRSIHRIRILNEQGRVRGLRFDANTGKPLPRSKGGAGSKPKPRTKQPNKRALRR